MRAKSTFCCFWITSISSYIKLQFRCLKSRSFEFTTETLFIWARILNCSISQHLVLYSHSISNIYMTWWLCDFIWYTTDLLLFDICQDNCRTYWHDHWPTLTVCMDIITLYGIAHHCETLPSYGDTLYFRSKCKGR